MFAHCGSQFCYQKGSFFSPPLFTERLLDSSNVGFHSLDSAGTRSYAPGRGGIVAKKKTPVTFVVRPSVRMYQLGFHWTDFYEIWYRVLLLKYTWGKNQTLIKVGQKVTHFTRTPKYFFYVLHTFEHTLKL